MNTLFPTLYILLQSVGLTAAVRLSNELCNPRPTVIPVGSPQFYLFPYFVTLNRCIGSCNMIQPTVQRCVATKQVPLQVQAFSLRHYELKMITLFNHTECGHECVVQPSHCHPEREIWIQDQCKCACRFDNVGPTPCKKGFTWDKESCDCVCDKAPEICPANQVWSADACSCVCKNNILKRCKRKGLALNERNCSCVRAPRAVKSAQSVSEDPGKPEPEAVITVRAAIILCCTELALLCVVFDSFLYRKKTGFVFGLKAWLCCSRRSSSDV